MKKIIYSLLVTTAITGSTVYATQAPHRPTTSVPTLKTDSSICPDDLNMTQLNEIKEGKLKLGGFKFDLHTSKPEFEAMLPTSILQPLSKAKSIAHIKSRSFAPTTKGRVLDCTYDFRTAAQSILPKKLTGVKTFTITSEPTKFEKDLPEGLAEAIVGG